MWAVRRAVWTGHDRNAAVYLNYEPSVYTGRVIFVIKLLELLELLEQQQQQQLIVVFLISLIIKQ